MNPGGNNQQQSVASPQRQPSMSSPGTTMLRSAYSTATSPAPPNLFSSDDTLKSGSRPAPLPLVSTPALLGGQKKEISCTSALQETHEEEPFKKVRN